MLLIAGSACIDTHNRDELIETAIEIAGELRKQAGCTHLAISADLEDPGVLHLIQKWDSPQALRANLVGPHIAAIAGHAGKLGVREMAMLKYDIAWVGPAGVVRGSDSGAVAVLIAGALRLDPARRDDAIALATGTMRAARSRKGSLSYVMSADIEDPGVLRMFAEWESEEALRGHLLDPSAAAARKRFDDVGLREIDLQRFDVRSVGPIV